jgi:serine/threonine-protein kinase
MSDEFDTRNRAQWAAAIEQTFGDNPPRSAQWSDVDSIVRVLMRFMGQNLNHTMMPGGGGLDMEAIARSVEPGCVEFSPADRMANVFRPGVVYFEHFPESPWNSFFLVETRTLEPFGVYEESSGEYEEVVELSPGEYVDRSHHDTGILDYDEQGNEIPLPPSARSVGRHFKGKFLVVAKQSIWNRASVTYDGRHNGMTAKEIRALIQSLIDEGHAQ